MDVGPDSEEKMKRFFVCALALQLFVGCSGESQQDEFTKEQAQSSKADGMDGCSAIDAPADCDICMELGWYDDHVCDTFCPEPDPDCSPCLDGEQRCEGCPGDDEDFCVPEELGCPLLLCAD
jgi:hypothetical protein